MTNLTTREKVQQSMKKRRAAEARFRLYGMASIFFGVLALVVLFGDILYKGLPTFSQAVIKLQVQIDKEQLELSDNPSVEQLSQADYSSLIKKSLREKLNTKTRSDRLAAYGIISTGAQWQLRDYVVSHPSVIGQTIEMELTADTDVDQWLKYYQEQKDQRVLSEQRVQMVKQLIKSGELYNIFNISFFINGDSREPELAGIRGAIIGSLLTLLVTFLLSFPIGIAAAIYLEEFAPKNRITEIVEININNLAAVPSIIFGLLGLAIFINVFGVARSTPLIGGLVLTLMTLPTIIIAARAAIKSVPPSIREAAYGVGASKVQMVFHHVLPLAMPGMLTGSIIGMAQALGETAPLLMIGMIAFVVDVPGFINDPATVLPVQIFLWSDSPERAFTEKTSGAIIVLLSFLIMMNAVAVMLRRRLERRW